jgi:uncharacterized protein YlzI (FlbEa/FlbD family)
MHRMPSSGAAAVRRPAEPEDGPMISLTRTTGERCCLDPAHMVRVESDPDTVVTMTDGARYVVVETIAQVVERVRNFRAAVLVSAWRWVHVPEGEAGTVVTRSSGPCTR